jgi:predicted dehydrogenase
MAQANTYEGRSTKLEGQAFRVALIGAGGIANAHYRGYTAAGAVIVGFVDPFEPTRTRREKEWGITGYSSFEELLAAEVFEAVSICTPNAYHTPASIQAALAGKHVLCEKPLSMSLADCQKMIDAARNASVVLQTGHHLRANLLVEKSKELISSGAIGRVTFIRLRQTHDWGGNKTVADSFGKLANSGGGTLLDNGCHMFDLARNLGGDVKNIFARTATLGFDIEVEDVANASLEFESGAIGSVESSWTATGWEEGWWVYGTDGALECTNRLGTRKLRHVHRTSSGTDWATPDETIYSFADEGGHSREIVAFISSVRHGTPVICTGEDGLESVRLVLKAYESAKLGQPLELK